jgi:polyadenylate-binding protein
LAPSVDNKGLFDVFSVFGNILSCKVATDETGNSKGYGYVHYETAEAAQDAIQKVNGMVVDDQEVYVGLFVKRQERAGQSEWTNMYVKQFPETWDDPKLLEVFSAYGNVTSAKVARDAEGKCKGFGFVNYADHTDAEKCYNELNGKSIEDPSGNFEIYVNRAQKKTERNREIKTRIETIRNDRMNKFQGMNLYVKNVDDSVTDDEFRAVFASIGTITSARIMRDEQGSRGFGFVCFSSPEEATRAVQELNNKMVHSKPIFVTLHQRKEHRRAHLAATYGSRMAGMARGFPSAPMPYMYMPTHPGAQPGMLPGQQPRQPFPMMPPNMMQPPRGPRGMPNYPRQQGAYPMMPYNMPQQGQQLGMQQAFKRPPMNGPMQGPGALGQGPQNRRNPGPGRGIMNGPPRGGPMQGQPQMPVTRMVPGAGPVNNLKYTAQARNQPQGGMGMPPQMMMQQNPGGPAVHQQQSGPVSNDPLDHQMLAQADSQTQKNMIGERLYPLIHRHHAELAGKITGMLLQMDNAELLHLLESPEALSSKVDEAIQVLRIHQGNE